MLPDQVVNRIAAGEVVERPASVVKELLENSLDAEAGRIDVELSEGGRTLVRVSDDGCGMDADDALLALERHATSKIGSADDLANIATLGFRGEALPSMASVSRVTLLTCADPAQGGVRVTVEGGRILATEGAARPRGTTVEVRDLFFNTPARRKFLHAPETELRHCQDAVAAAALARPDVSFTLSHGGRALLDVRPVSDPAERLRELWRKVEAPVYRFAAGGGSVEVWGLLARGRGSGRPVVTAIVNGRPVRDRLLTGAVLRALRESGSGFGGARVALFLELAPDAVDVNVHPAKAEVRFARAGSVFAMVDRAVRGGVKASQGRVDVGRVEAAEGVAESRAWEAAQTTGAARPVRGPALFPHPAYDGDPGVVDGRYGRGPSAENARPSGARPGAPDTPFGRLIGQYRDSFLLLEDDWGLVIVDQHVAHERVLYERIRHRLAGAPAPSQRMLEPLLVEVGEADAAALPRIAELLERVGIDADRFGPDTVRITALPPEVDPEAIGRVLAELLERANAADGMPDRLAERLTEDIAASLSCRAAIKVNHRLSPQEQRALLGDLGSTDNPYRCPHGRPIVLRLSQDEMERRLGRR